MSASKLFSLANAIRLMVLIGIVTVFMVAIKSCQVPETGLERFRGGALSRLEVIETPPPQPDMIMGNLGEQAMQLKDFRGQILLVNVWATWCPPCVAEMPMLDRLQSDIASDDFQVVTISMDRTANEAAAFFERNGITALTPWHGSIDLSAKLRAPGLPISIFYNRQGREVARIAGEVDWDKAEVRAFIQHLIEG